ncbi:MAG: hypothetical protein QM493_07110 [Sulfurovum sp.]
MEYGKYFIAEAIDYRGQLKKIPKSKNQLQPLFEAFTNAIEAIKLSKNSKCGKINIQLKFIKDLIKEELEEITFIDNGIGFDDENFGRFKKLHDNSKDFFNQGSGRIQYIHFFDKVEFKSIYEDKKSNTGFYKRSFILSKSKSFLDKNSIIYYDEPIEEDAKITNTKVVLKNLINKSNKSFYNKLSIEKFKDEIITHYLDYFSENRDNLPDIIIEQIIDGHSIKKLKICTEDIAKEDKKEEIQINYKYFASDGKTLLRSRKKENFQIKAFKLDKDILSINSLKLTSKHEIIEGEIAKKVELEVLKKDDSIDNKRYLFLISSNYLNIKDDDVRGNVEIYTEKEFRKNKSLFKEEEVILIDDIQDEVNSHILSMYSEIMDRKNEHELDIKKLQEMFLLNKKTLKSLKINIQDTDETILKKVYKADAQIIAGKDAKIKEQIESLNNLDPSNNSYQDELESKISLLVKEIPLQNRTALTHTVARRKLVLELFQTALDNELQIQKTTKRNLDEKLLHNIIFQQSSNNPEKSDLWLINEDFIYYKGSSESTLGDIELNNDSIFKSNLTEEEDTYRLKQQGNANQKRPDILLFPDEGKCILIEFKSPSVNVSDHLNQLNRYASLINNLSKDKYSFKTYYGYLIGENIDIDDIIDNDSDFISAESLKFVFRPHKRIVGKFDKQDGSLYTEIIKYSTLLERAKKRNKIFIDKLMGTSE